MAKANALATALLERTGAPAKDQEFKESFEVTKPALMSGFRGMFGERSLSQHEEERIATILREHSLVMDSLDEDCKNLSRITSEIKAISNQSILLHGERIKKAQEILKGYKEGAFTEWLFATYGNRQTPYSMLQYFELYSALPPKEKALIEALPKKAAYTLASRGGALEAKVELLREYKGEKQQEMISRIREAFPGDSSDKRMRPISLSLIHELERVIAKIETKKEYFSQEDRKRIRLLGKKLMA